MLLSEIQPLIAQAFAIVKEINPKTKCHLVIMLGFDQFFPDQVNDRNVDLFKHARIFEHVTESALSDYNRFGTLRDEIKAASEKQKGKPSKEARKAAESRDAEFAVISARLLRELPLAQFVAPQFELRFDSLDMDTIQEIKMHPLIRNVGKTEMSAASIRVVVL